MVAVLGSVAVGHAQRPAIPLDTLLVSATSRAAAEIATGTRAVEDLPHSCRCGTRWSGSNTAHCAACHRYTFSGIGGFDLHRKGGVCTDPAELGLTPLPGRAYEVWGARAIEEAA